MSYSFLPTLATCAFLSLSAFAQLPTNEVARLTDAAGSNDDYFGISVSVDYPRIAVGSTRTSASRVGAVFVYATIDGRTWMLEQEITPPTPVNGMRFSGVALSGDTLAIAAVREPVSGLADAGAVYLYQRGAGSPAWALAKKLTAAVPQTGGYFGSQLALEGDVLAVSETSPSTSSRLIRVYQRNHGGPDNWGLVASPLGSLVNAANAASYGNALSLSGSELAVLQYSTGGSGTALGAAYVFAQNQGGANHWGEIAAIQNAALEFGASSLALSGDTLAVDRRIIGGTATANHVAMFSRNQGGANTWGLLKLVRAATPLTGDDFGFPIALSGPLLLAGAHWDDQDGTDSGAAYLFGQNQGGTNNWGQLAKLKGSGNATLHDFSYAVDVDNDVAVIGAPSDNTPGSAYVFARAALDQPFRIVQILRVGQERQVAFKTDQDNHYYVLRRGDTLAAIGNPVDLKMAPRGTNILQAVESAATTGFYKVERVPVSAPVDSDGDGANDLLELDFQPYRSPLTAADASVIPPVFLDAVPEQTTNTSEIVTGRAWPGTTVTIAGGSSVVSGQVSQVGTYAFNIPLRQNRMNRLFLSANGSAPVAVNITHDREPPTLYVDFPSTGSETIETTTTLAGRVGDVLSGALGLNVTINGQPAAVAIGLGQNGTFDKPNLPLALGSNTFTIVATDALGNRTTRTHTVVRKAPGAYRMERVSGDAQFAAVHNLVPQPLTVRVIDGNGQPFAEKLVDFQVTRSDGELLPGPSFNLPRTRTYQVRTDETGLARAWWMLGGTAGCAADRVEATSAGVDGKATFCATARPGPASQINIGAGNNQIAEVGAPAPAPLKAWVNDSCNGIVNLPVTFTVTEGNGTVNGQSSVTVNTGPTGHAEVDFRLATDGTRNAVEATFAGNPGLPAVFTSTGRIRNPLQPTVFRGLVLDNANQPLGGAQVWAYVNGQAFPTANTDAQGFFELPDLPAGAGSLFVDGAFATALNGQSIPQGSFPSLSYEVVVTANTINELPTPVRLPRLDPANSVVFNNSQDVILRCAGIEGLELKVKAGSMRKADGSLVSPGNLAILSLNQVHHDEVPMPMPDGASPPFAWTLQPGGATFNPPIEITYPNMSGLAPGATAYFLTYNHALEQFQIVSSGQVSEDGSVIKSDAGSGLNLAGWGCNCPPYSVAGKCESVKVKITEYPNEVVLTGNTFTLVAKGRPKPASSPFTWTVSDTSVATIVSETHINSPNSSAGTLTLLAQEEGEVTVTVRYLTAKGKQATDRIKIQVARCVVEFVDPPAAVCDSEPVTFKVRAKPEPGGFSFQASGGLPSGGSFAATPSPGLYVSGEFTTTFSRPAVTHTVYSPVSVMFTCSNGTTRSATTMVEVLEPKQTYGDGIIDIPLSLLDPATVLEELWPQRNGLEEAGMAKAEWNILQGNFPLMGQYVDAAWEAGLAAYNAYGSINDGTVANAFLHAAWNYILARMIGKAQAQQLTDAHEDVRMNDCANKRMDLNNNKFGLDLADKHNKSDNEIPVFQGLSELKRLADQGRLTTLR